MVNLIVMKHGLTSIVWLLLVAPSWAQITYPYNPDGDANGLIGVTDLQDLLSTYGGAFSPGTITVNSVELGEVLDSLQSQITALKEASENGFRCGDDVLHEGYWYNTTSIGGQCWFSENVRYLPEVSPSSVGSDILPHAYVYDYQGSDVELAKYSLNYHQYGVLYNFRAVEQWDLCPSGWHVPTDEEWTAMSSSLGSEGFAGSMMKLNFGDSWNGTNLSGFSGLPGGGRYIGGFFSGAGEYGGWWSTSFSDYGVWYRGLGSSYENVDRYDHDLRLGFSVRCVRDAE